MPKAGAPEKEVGDDALLVVDEEQKKSIVFR
jgi:hypothetical protein